MTECFIQRRTGRDPAWVEDLDEASTELCIASSALEKCCAAMSEAAKKAKGMPLADLFALYMDRVDVFWRCMWILNDQFALLPDQAKWPDKKYYDMVKKVFKETYADLKCKPHWDEAFWLMGEI